MDKVEAYLKVVPLPLIALGAIAFFGILIIIPRRFRIQITVGFMTMWMMVNKLTGLGMVAYFSKTTAAVACIGVGFAAMLDSEPRRRIPVLAWLYVVAALGGFVFVLGVDDRIEALVVRFQWFVMVICAMLLARTVTDQRTLCRVLHGIVGGLVVSVVILLSAILFARGSSFKGGVGRFTPYGGLPNVYGLIFIFGTIFTVYFGVYGKTQWIKPFLLAVATISFGLGVLTAARTIVFGMVIGLSPLGAYLVRRPTIAVIGAVIVSLLLGWVLRLGDEQADLSRLRTLQTSRYVIWDAYWEIVRERPLFGLMGVKGENSKAAWQVGEHPHSAYLHTLYLGGMVFAAPQFLLILVSIIAVFYAIKRRKSLPYDPVLIVCCGVLLLDMYLLAIFGGAIYYPTYSWAFIHVFLAVLFLGIAGDARAIKKAARAQTTTQQAAPATGRLALP